MQFEFNSDACSETVLPHDGDLVQEVVRGLQTRLGSPVQNFQLAARDDGLILRGQVRTHYGKQMAQEVVMQLSGLSVLANDIEVQCANLGRKDSSQLTQVR